MSKAIKIAEKIFLLNKKLRREYLKVLGRSFKSSYLKLLKKVKLELLQRKVAIQLSKGNASKL